MTDIGQNILSVKAQINDLNQQYQQNAELLAVSKTKPKEDVITAYHAGQRKFGENYVQEGVEKIAALQSYTDIEWHFIGPLQSNKTKPVAEYFDWVQSIDRLKIAKRLNDQRPANKGPLNVCIQVNISNEANKSGVVLEELEALAQQVAQLPELKLRGLMAIPLKTHDTMELSEMFIALQKAFINLKDKYPTIDTLSMGMTADMQLAIKNGSTMVRIGTAIFGAREKPNSKKTEDL
ncbi:YggS family pyridoxal phosphate-dependent enzyme [Catenovulum sediminis]|uniref:Pyridoxal phosphate homeostasis protein n=1 Tax=Catenovulum sediminis TaxID=1740262 RepID=A0ABV1RL47_9ALTE|nr:YggS family pyridoxal phosphate-dependent enzyme [Catenovulum sediminis]